MGLPSVKGEHLAHSHTSAAVAAAITIEHVILHTCTGKIQFFR